MKPKRIYIEGKEGGEEEAVKAVPATHQLFYNDKI